jgi:hypothetical protein
MGRAKGTWAGRHRPGRTPWPLSRLLPVGLALAVVAGSPSPASSNEGQARIGRAPAASIVASHEVRAGLPRKSEGSSSLSAMAVGDSWVTLGWALPKQTAKIELRRGSRLLDVFGPGGAPAYRDRLLWPSTTYTYRITALDDAGAVIASIDLPVTTAPMGGSVPRFYSANSFWNRPIGAHARVDTDSAAMIASSILPWGTHAVIDSDAAWGIPIAFASGHSTKYEVGCTKYGCDTPVTFRIPRYAKPSTGSDGHLAVYDPATHRELDMWQASYDAATDTWTASARTVSPARWGAMCRPGEHCGGGGVAAGFNEWAGVIRPEEIAQGHIDHALVISMPHVRADYLACPATNVWAPQGSGYADDPNALPLGAHIRLSPAFDVAAQSWPRWEKIVAVALQRYGAYVADLDATVTLRGEPNLDRGYDAWAKVDMQSEPHPSLRNLPWDQFEVLSLQPC